MDKHYKIFQLINEEGKWALPALQKISTYLLPEDISESKSEIFVEVIAVLAGKNPYLVHFLEKIQNENLSSYLKK